MPSSTALSQLFCRLHVSLMKPLRCWGTHWVHYVSFLSLVFFGLNYCNKKSYHCESFYVTGTRFVPIFSSLLSNELTME